MITAVLDTTYLVKRTWYIKTSLEIIVSLVKLKFHIRMNMNNVNISVLFLNERIFLNTNVLPSP